MKKSYILWVAISLICFTSQATIWRVNNQSTSTSNFSSIQAAIDNESVLNGDTLMVNGSAVAYSGCDVTKRLYILGSGYLLNVNPKTSLDGAASIIKGIVQFKSGSEGSVLSGVIFDSEQPYYEPQISVDDITISRCFLSRGLTVEARVNDIIVSQNYLSDPLDVDQSYDAFQGMIFANNIVNANFSLETDTDDPRTFAAVENNLFLGDVELTTSTYRNNIWLPLESSTISVTAGIKEYNLNVSVDMGTENNNQIINGLTDLYAGEGSADGKWQIKSESEYKNAGKDGTDPGPFGGPNPYVLSGLPAFPIIYEISTTGFGSADEGLPVTIKVRSN